MTREISDEQIETLRVLCEHDFACNFTQLEARQMAMTLFDLFDWLVDLRRSGRMDHLLSGQDGDGTHASNA